MMTDQEIIRLCAEAMEPRATLPGSSRIWGVASRFGPTRTVETWVLSAYNPLNDDAQAMALVKKFDLNTAKIADCDWVVWRSRIDGHRDEMCNSADYNRAICECVAKMQAAK